MRIESGTTALDAFWAIQESAGVGEVTSGQQVLGFALDHVLRRAVLAGTDLAAVPVDQLLTPGASTQEGVRPTAVILAGGRGSRLQPLTFKVPKPLLQVGRATILGRVLENLFSAGVADVWIAVNYMADVIEGRIGNGEGYGLTVRYLHEQEPLDTAGPLSLLPERPDGPVLVLNSDQITNLNLARMVDYHLAERAAITVASFTHRIDIPYGVLRIDGTTLVGVDEKPTMGFPCSAGFYVLDPSVIDRIPKGKPLTMPELIEDVRGDGGHVAVFPLLETWIDIGTPEELEQALLMFATGEEV